MSKNGLLIVLFAQVVSLLWLTSCTYDYFEDETTYQVFVPEVLNNTVSDCRVLVYSNTGALVATRYAAYPDWNKDPRMATGLFSFKLPPGEYDVYCYTNTDSLQFADDHHIESSAFVLNEHPYADNHYVHPSDIHYQKYAAVVVKHPGILVTDTVQLARYTGRITVRFKNFPADVSRIKNVQLRAEGVSVMQYLKYHESVSTRLTTTSRLTSDDQMFHIDQLPAQTNPEILEVDHSYMPSIEDVPMELNFTFLTSDGLTVIHVPVDVRDKDTGQPLRLMSGERIIIEIDAYTVVNIGIVGWDEDIQTGKEIELG
ncbi:FimB/Mfa2 family fimbrial subunit [Bacteroides sp. UBA939]|uniref:FimB/Mfa2 family fimbrial subunit n=1 Tax=Bacteroides sp. UBA939 TaxID=1946092 RepID=UPI0025BC6098|nr:FimB/Mfa2 family fimbrial subunit [Bacteroides sp. UBA939]